MGSSGSGLFLFVDVVSVPCFYILFLLHRAETIRLEVLCKDLKDLFLKGESRPSNQESFGRATEAHEKLVTEFRRTSAAFEVVAGVAGLVTALGVLCMGLGMAFVPDKTDIGLWISAWISCFFVILPPALGVHFSIESANEAADDIRRSVPEVLSGISDTDTSISAMKFIMLCERRHCEISFNRKRPPSTSTILLTMTAVVIINVASYLGFEL